MTIPKSRIFLFCVGAAFLLNAGCGQTYYPDALDISEGQVNAIRNSETLEPQEMREALADYGISEVTINGLLASVRLANQFGGDLQSAYDKVVGGQLAEMTPDEIQFYGDATEATTITDSDAQSMVDFFEDNEIDTIDELQAFIDPDDDGTPNDVDESVDEQDLWDVFVDTNTDDVLAKL